MTSFIHAAVASLLQPPPPPPPQQPRFNDDDDDDDDGSSSSSSSSSNHNNHDIDHEDKHNHKRDCSDGFVTGRCKKLNATNNISNYLLITLIPASVSHPIRTCMGDCTPFFLVTHSNMRPGSAVEDNADVCVDVERDKDMDKDSGVGFVLVCFYFLSLLRLYYEYCYF
jgi:hypothetical protein